MEHFVLFIGFEMNYSLHLTVWNFICEIYFWNKILIKSF